MLTPSPYSSSSNFPYKKEMEILRKRVRTTKEDAVLEFKLKLEKLQVRINVRINVRIKVRINTLLSICLQRQRY